MSVVKSTCYHHTNLCDPQEIGLKSYRLLTKLFEFYYNSCSAVC